MVMHNLTQLHAVANLPADMHFECLHPTCSPNPAPCDHDMFGSFKESVDGKKLSLDGEIEDALHRWLHSKSDFFFSRNPGK